MASRSKMTQDATAASPIVCEISKHSMRCTDDGNPSASCNAARRSSCVAFCASFWRIANVAFCSAMASHTRRSPPGLPTISTFCPDCTDSTSASAAMIGGVRHDDRRRDRTLDVVLLEERRHDFGKRRGIDGIGMPRKERAVADVAAAADHHDIDGEETALRSRRDDVDVAGRRAFHELPRLQRLQAADLVANARRALEFERGRRRLHLRLQLDQHFIRLAAQEQRRAFDVVAIFLFADEAHAGRGAALDLVEHARPRTVGEHRVLARAQHEDLLQRRDAVADRARAGERSEVPVAAIERAAMEAQLRKRIARDADVRIALVVAEQDVVARLVRLDEIVLEQQRLAFGVRDGGLPAQHPSPAADRLSSSDPQPPASGRRRSSAGRRRCLSGHRSAGWRHRVSADGPG